MTTNQDILSFLRVDKEAKEKEKVEEKEAREKEKEEEKEAREKEKEEEKEARSKEREEDMAKIADMIRTGVRDEVRTAIQPVEDRMVLQEKITEGLGMQINTLMREMETLKGEVKNIQEFPALPKTGVPGLLSGAMDVDNGDGGIDYNKRVKGICGKSRRILGFTPIEPRMLEIQMQSYGAKNIEEAMLMEVKSYWKCEMKVRPSDIEKIDIVRIFHPAKENWNTLYVEFGSEYEVDKMFGYTKVMIKQDHRVVRVYPKELFERFQALDHIAFDMREEMKLKSVKLKTRVTVGKNDLEFSTKMPDSNWRLQPLPGGLPKIDLDAGARRAMTSSPPPGRPDRPVMVDTQNSLSPPVRPGRAEMLATAVEAVLANQKAVEAAQAERSRMEEDRKRQLSDTDGDEPVKRSKGNTDLEEIGEGNLRVEKTVDSSCVKPLQEMENRSMERGQQDSVEHGEGDCHSVKGLDPGKFVNLEGYCPSSPARAKKIPDLSVILNSPIYHSKVAKSLK